MSKDNLMTTMATGRRWGNRTISVSIRGFSVHEGRRDPPPTLAALIIGVYSALVMTRALASYLENIEMLFQYFS
jgi:hypothetical protein